MPTAKKNATPKKKSASKKKWSAAVTENSDALDLEQSVFAENDPKKIAASLKRSAKRSRRRKGRPLQSAMSVLNFYINRGGKNLPGPKMKVLEDAKGELRKLFKERDKEKRDKMNEHKK